MNLQDIKDKLVEAENLAEIGREVKLTRSYLSALARDTEGKLNPSYATFEKLKRYFSRDE